MYASEDHLVLLPQTIVSPTEYDACASITAGIHVLITCGGQLNLRLAPWLEAMIGVRTQDPTATHTALPGRTLHTNQPRVNRSSP